MGADMQQDVRPTGPEPLSQPGTGAFLVDEFLQRLRGKGREVIRPSLFQNDPFLMEIRQSEDRCLSLLVPRDLSRQVARQEGIVISQQCFQPDVFGSVEVQKRLPDGSLADGKDRMELFFVESFRRSQEVGIDPGAVLMQTLEDGNGIQVITPGFLPGSYDGRTSGLAPDSHSSTIRCLSPASSETISRVRESCPPWRCRSGRMQSRAGRQSPVAPEAA